MSQHTKSTTPDDDAPTPAPWRVGSGEDGVFCFYGHDGLVGRTWTDIDAAHLCHAVNCHADLLAACRAALEWITEDCRERDEIVAAVAKATGN